jgi:hypothetical protein
MAMQEFVVPRSIPSTFDAMTAPDAGAGWKQRDTPFQDTRPDFQKVPLGESLQQAQHFFFTICIRGSRLRNPNALRRKGLKACQAFHYPDKMGLFPKSRKIFPKKVAFLPHAKNI